MSLRFRSSVQTANSVLSELSAAPKPECLVSLLLVTNARVVPPYMRILAKLEHDSLTNVKKADPHPDPSKNCQLFYSGDASSIRNRPLAYTGIISGINLLDRVQLATKLEHFVGRLVLKDVLSVHFVHMQAFPLQCNCIIVQIPLINC